MYESRKMLATHAHRARKPVYKDEQDEGEDEEEFEGHYHSCGYGKLRPESQCPCGSVVRLL